MNLANKEKQFLRSSSVQMKKKSLNKQIKKQPNHMKDTNYDHLQKKRKENLMFSLASLFEYTKNQASLIYPWLNQFQQLQQRIIGTNYIITGPTKSGKYSAVRYALETFYPDVKQILVDCAFYISETQIILKLLSQFKAKSPNSKWPEDQREIMRNLVTSSENIDFKKLNPYIQKGNLKFVIIIKNGERLVGFKKQTILYNLFEWMNSQLIQQRGGLVILTRKLMLIDKFQKRVKSRFCGNSLRIFRPQKSQIFINIILKRIQAVIDNKKGQQQIQKIQSNQMVQYQKQITDKKSNSRSKQKLKQKQNKKKKIIKQQKIKKQNESLDLNKLLNIYSQYQFVKQVEQYLISFQNYLSMDRLEQLGINRYIVSKLQQFSNSRNKKQMRLFRQQSRLLIWQQIQCLNRLRGGIQNNKQLKLYLDRQLQGNQIIQICSVLGIFQHIFLTLDEGIIQYLSQQNISKLIVWLYIRFDQDKIPNNNKIQMNNMIQSIIFSNIDMNNVQLLLLVLIYKAIQINENKCNNNSQQKRKQYRSVIKLSYLYDKYKSILDKQISNNIQRTSNKIPIKILQRSMLKLYDNKIILIYPNNIWNSQIILLIQKSALKLYLSKLYHNKHKQLPQIIKNHIKKLGIKQQTNHPLITIN